MAKEIRKIVWVDLLPSPTFLQTQLPSLHGLENHLSPESRDVEPRPLFLVGEKILLLVFYGTNVAKIP